jgi:hypothetical protein
MAEKGKSPVTTRGRNYNYNYKKYKYKKLFLFQIIVHFYFVDSIYFL